LTPEEEARLGAARSVSPEAHEAYLMGRYAFNKRTEAGLKQALQYYQRAIDLDPGYAAAHAAMASTYNVMQFYAGFSPTIVFPLAREAGQRALQLDDSLAEAHAALARVAAFTTGNGRAPIASSNGPSSFTRTTRASITPTAVTWLPLAASMKPSRA